MSLAYILKDLVGFIPGLLLRAIISAAFILVGAGVAVHVGIGEEDILALVGSAIALVSRIVPQLHTTMLLIVISTIFWGVYGALVSSYGQIVFSIVYAGMALYRFFVLRSAL